MSVPYIFASATSALPLSELDANFATPITLGATALILGGTYTDIDGLKLTTPIFTSPTLDTPLSGDLANCTGYIYANLAGTAPTWNQNTTGNAATATNATNATNLVTADFSIKEAGGKLCFYYGTTLIASLDSSGDFIALANVTAYGTP